MTVAKPLPLTCCVLVARVVLVELWKLFGRVCQQPEEVWPERVERFGSWKEVKRVPRAHDPPVPQAKPQALQHHFQ